MINVPAEDTTPTFEMDHARGIVRGSEPDYASIPDDVDSPVRKVCWLEDDGNMYCQFIEGGEVYVCIPKSQYVNSESRIDVTYETRKNRISELISKRYAVKDV